MQNSAKSNENLEQNQASETALPMENLSKNGENADNTRLQSDFEGDLSACNENTEKNGSFMQNNEFCGQNSAFSELISRDFEEFSRVNPNISRESLYNNKMLVIFASGKENQGLSSIYKDFSALVNAIESEALAKARHQISLEQGSVGALSGAFSPSEPYFTREQVQKMTSNEIKKHFEAIRRSQAHW